MVCDIQPIPNISHLAVIGDGLSTKGSGRDINKIHWHLLPFVACILGNVKKQWWSIGERAIPGKDASTPWNMRETADLVRLVATLFADQAIFLFSLY